MRQLSKSVIATIILIFILPLLSCYPALPSPVDAPKPKSEITTGDVQNRQNSERILFSANSKTTKPAVSAESLNLHSSEPITLDPALADDQISQKYILSIFSGLVRLGDKQLPEADIAQQCTLDADGKIYSFSLRRDVKFQDGRGVKASDFKFSWERACNPELGSKMASDLLGDIVGVKEMLAGKAREISGIKAIDDFTLQITIDSPKSFFLYKLTSPLTFVVDEHNIDSGKDWWQKPNGTGPFSLKEWKKGKQIILNRNPDYYGEQASVASIIFETGEQRPIDLYEDGTVDAVEVTSSYFDRVMDKQGSFISELRIVPELSLYGIGFNTNKPPFDDINVRLAFCHAADVSKVVTLAYQNRIKAASGLLPPGIQGFSNKLYSLKFDVDLAKELIAKSRYANKLPGITLTCPGSGGRISPVITAILYEWKKNLGVDVDVRLILQDRFSYHLKEEVNELFLVDWVADYPHPQNFLEVLFQSKSARNYGGYADEEVDSLLEKAAQQWDSGQNSGLYGEIEQRLINRGAILPLRFGQNFYLVKPYVKGYEINTLGFTQYNRVVVESHWQFAPK